MHRIMPFSGAAWGCTCVLTLSVHAQGRRALLAEDNLINQRVAQKMLTNLGLVCEVACNGQEAVTLSEKGATRWQDPSMWCSWTWPCLSWAA